MASIGQIKLFQGLEANLPTTGALNELYFCVDTGRLFKGTITGMKIYSDIITVNDVTTVVSPEQGKIYLDTSNYTVKAYNGTGWKTLGGDFTATSTDELENKTIDATKNIITNLETTNFNANAISTVIPSTGAVDTKLTTEKAVADLKTALDGKIDQSISGVSYDSTAQKWTFTKEDTTTIEISNILDALIKQVTYNATTKQLTFTFDGDPTPTPVNIDISDLVDVYTVADTDTVDMTMTGNSITANVKISTDADNLLTKGTTDKGLYVALEWNNF